MLDRLARMVDEKQLRTPIDCELSWTGIADAAERLVQQRVNGKIVLRVED